jgi:ketosteroid isomerase-like protein
VSQASTAALRRVIEAFNSGDLERILASIHPDFEAVVPPEFSAEPDTYRGHEGVRRYFETFAEAMEDVRFEPGRMWDAGDVVVVEMRVTAKGKQTGIPVEQRFEQTWRIRDGRALAVHIFPSLARALEVAGLPVDARPVDDGRPG